MVTASTGQNASATMGGTRRLDSRRNGGWFVLAAASAVVVDIPIPRGQVDESVVRGVCGPVLGVCVLDGGTRRKG